MSKTMDKSGGVMKSKKYKKFKQGCNVWTVYTYRGYISKQH